MLVVRAGELGFDEVGNVIGPALGTIAIRAGCFDGFLKLYVEVYI